VTIVSANWEIDAELRYYPAAKANQGASWIIPSITVEGPAQVYITEVDGEEPQGKLIAAQLTSNTTVAARPDGTADAWTWDDD
jgi:hypothetical protein